MKRFKLKVRGSVSLFKGPVYLFKVTIIQKNLYYCNLYKS